MFRAFVRGRRSRNLVERGLEGVALDRRVGDLRAELGVAAPGAEEQPGDRAAFTRCAVWAATIVWGPLVPIGLGLWWWLGR